MKGKSLTRNLNRRVEYEQGLIEALQQDDFEAKYTYAKPEPKYHCMLIRLLVRSYKASSNLMRTSQKKRLPKAPPTK